ncbi:MAG: hypothetical protein ACYST3_07225 [Planctomycetota bacterium]|jgi:hypothetical protein
MTPERFLSKAKDIAEKYAESDPEAFHCETDRLMEETMIELGFIEGINEIRQHTRWCA